MKRILLLLVNRFPHAALDYAVDFAKHSGATIEAIFVEKLSLADKEGYFFPSDINATDVDYTLATDKEETLARETDEVKLLHDRCKFEQVNLAIQFVRNNVEATLVTRTAFTDLAICDSNLDTELFNKQHFLSQVQCPVLIVPIITKGIFGSIVFAFGGHLSDMLAIKSMTALLPWCHSCKVEVITVQKSDTIAIAYRDELDQWLNDRYSASNWVVLKGDTTEKIKEFMKERPNSLLVMGALGRGILSRFFKDSVAMGIMESTEAPIFISHA